MPTINVESFFRMLLTVVNPCESCSVENEFDTSVSNIPNCIEHMQQMVWIQI